MHEGIAQELIDVFGRLPGIGPKGSQRIAYHLLVADKEELDTFVRVVGSVQDRIKFCVVCGNVAEVEQCRICLDPRRNQTLICAVEEFKDIIAVERTGLYSGLYHVLGGALSPIDGVGPDDLRIRELLTRLKDHGITELLIATDPDLEGEATAQYIARLLDGSGIAVTRPASGLPVGGELEYADEVTLGRALEGRRRMDEERQKPT